MSAPFYGALFAENESSALYAEKSFIRKAAE